VFRASLVKDGLVALTWAPYICTYVHLYIFTVCFKTPQVTYLPRPQQRIFTEMQQIFYQFLMKTSGLFVNPQKMHFLSVFFLTIKVPFKCICLLLNVLRFLSCFSWQLISFQNVSSFLTILLFWGPHLIRH